MCNAVYFPNPFELDRHTAWPVAEGVTVQQWLDDNKDKVDLYMPGRPVLVVLNGEELRECDFDTVIKPDDLLYFTRIPQATVIAAVVTFVVEYFAIIAAVVALGVTLYGIATQPDFSEGSVSDSPNYGLNARGNRARLGEPIPVLYGKARVFPDLSAQPFTEFRRDGDEIITMLYEVSQGEVDVDIATMRFEDTLLSSFQDVEYEIVPPGTRSSLFPQAVDIAVPVANIELGSGFSSAYAANRPNTLINRIAFEAVAPAGLYRQRTQGDPQRLLIVLAFEVRPIDNSGAPQGAWDELGRHTLSGSNPDAIRRTYEYELLDGRYEARINRITDKVNGSKISDVVEWSELRGYLTNELPPTQTTKIAIRIRGSNNIGTRALTKFNAVCTRRLPIYQANGTWSTPQPTRSPAWAFADLCRATYGGKRPEQYIDLAGLRELAPILQSEGFYTDGIFDTKTDLWSALGRIAMSAFGERIERGGVYQLVLDREQTVPVMLYNHRNIVQGTFNIDHAGVLEETADHIVIKYFAAEQDYRLTEVVCALPGSPLLRSKEITLWGVTERVQAYEIGMRYAALNKYRRERLTWITTLDGRIPRWGELVKVSHHLLGVQGAEQRSGDVLSQVNNVLQLSEVVQGIFTNAFITLTDRRGQPVGPYPCQITGEREVSISGAFSQDGLIFEANRPLPKFSVGEGSEFETTARVTKVTPQSDQKFRIEAHTDAPIVYGITQGATPPPATTLEDLKQFLPSVTALALRLGGTRDNPEVRLSWRGSNADRYDVEFSYNGGADWIDAGEDLLQPKYLDRPSKRGSISYRVAGVSILRGPWAQISVDTNTGEISIPAENAGRIPVDAIPIGARWGGGSTDIRLAFNFIAGGTPDDGEIYMTPGTLNAALLDGSEQVEVLPASPLVTLLTPWEGFYTPPDERGFIMWRPGAVSNINGTTYSSSLPFTKGFYIAEYDTQEAQWYATNNAGVRNAFDLEPEDRICFIVFKKFGSTGITGGSALIPPLAQDGAPGATGGVGPVGPVGLTGPDGEEGISIVRVYRAAATQPPTPIGNAPASWNAIRPPGSLTANIIWVSERRMRGTTVVQDWTVPGQDNGKAGDIISADPGGTLDITWSRVIATNTIGQSSETLTPVGTESNIATRVCSFYRNGILNGSRAFTAEYRPDQGNIGVVVAGDGFTTHQISGNNSANVTVKFTHTETLASQSYRLSYKENDVTVKT